MKSIQVLSSTFSVSIAGQIARMFAVGLLSVGLPGLGQEAASPVAPQPATTSPTINPATVSPVETTAESNQFSEVFETLSGLQASLSAKEEEIKTAQANIAAATDEPTRVELETELTRLQDEAEELQGKFEELAVEVDTSIFNDEPPKEFDLRKEIEKVLEPVVSGLKNATADSRLIEALRGELETQRQRESIAGQAVTNLNHLIKGQPDPELRGTLERMLATWQQRQTDAHNQGAAIDRQLDQKLKAKQSVYESTRGFLKNFMRSRGLHLLLGIGAFCLVFFGMRFGYALWRKFRPIKVPTERSFVSRLGSMIYHFCSVLFAILAMMLVFNLTGDWFLFGITLLLLVGFIWASFKTLPLFIEQIKLILNFGSVREGHRIIWEGIPWQVNSLGFQARLENPLLSGGHLEMPVKFLVGQHSRLPGPREEWFPSREGDWVELNDGTIGRVSYQTPSVVQLIPLGGTQMMIPTPQYLEMNPGNMSTNYRREITFLLDYQHQDIATTKIPELLSKALHKGLIELLSREELLHVEVEFKAAAPNGFEYEVQADVKGSAAAKYEDVERAMARILVEACLKNGWVMPVPQIRLQAPISGAGS